MFSSWKCVLFMWECSQAAILCLTRASNSIWTHKWSTCHWQISNKCQTMFWVQINDPEFFCLFLRGGKKCYFDVNAESCFMCTEVVCRGQNVSPSTFSLYSVYFDLFIFHCALGGFVPDVSSSFFSDLMPLCLEPSSLFFRPSTGSGTAQLRSSKWDEVSFALSAANQNSLGA